jgi:hypothetical protein|tara:strand:- start:847 stop:1149 length:303 start_codon:yes stop_codon:yes gene_type:complete
MELHNPPPVYERVIHYNQEHEVQIRLSVNSFRGTEYLHLRKYYLDFDENWKPSSDGVAMPLDFSNSKELFIGLTEILSLAESKEIIEEQFQDLINNLYLK